MLIKTSMFIFWIDFKLVKMKETFSIGESNENILSYTLFVNSKL